MQRLHQSSKKRINRYFANPVGAQKCAIGVMVLGYAIPAKVPGKFLVILSAVHVMVLANADPVKVPENARFAMRNM